MKYVQSTLLVFVACWGVTSMAQYPQPQPVSCNTQSNGLFFSKTEMDLGLAQQLAVQSCQNDSRTSNLECSANVSCDGQYAAPMLTCSTWSNGLQFSKVERDPNLARQLAVQSCQNDSRTSNPECSANVACDGQYATPFMTCRTFSNGLTFNRTERDSDLARRLATENCQNDSRTNNAECSANVTCDNSPQMPFYQCTTFSNGLSFERTEHDAVLSSQLAVQTCQNDSRTNNAECSANVTCTMKY